MSTALDDDDDGDGGVIIIEACLPTFALLMKSPQSLLTRRPGDVKL